MTALQAAALYLSRGLWPIPIPLRKKKPVLRGWPSLRLSEADLPRYFNGATNVGILLGDDYGSADVDIDCDEAAAAARVLLPETRMIWGRKSSPASHYGYRADPAVRTKQYADPIEKKSQIVELRGLKNDGTVGLQTVVPPSVHPEGEEVRWESGCDALPANIDAAALESAVAQVAAAALLARYWPGPKSGRNPAFLALAGAAARAGWTLEQTQTFVGAIYRVLWADVADLNQANAEVRITFEKYSKGQPVSGRPALEKLGKTAAVGRAFEWLRLKADAASWVPPAPTIMLAAGAVEPHIDMLNAMALFYGRVRFKSIKSRGPLIVAEFEGADKEAIWGSTKDLLNFATGQAIIADATGIVLPHPPRTQLRALWEPASQAILNLAGKDRVTTSDALREEFAHILYATWKRAGCPSVTDADETKADAEFLQLLKLCGTHERDHAAPPPKCAVWHDHCDCFVHQPTLLEWLSTPHAKAKHYPWPEVDKALLLLGFRPEQIHRSVKKPDGRRDIAKVRLWRGPIDVLTDDESEE